jgi:hypothetical protein
VPLLEGCVDHNLSHHAGAAPILFLTSLDQYFQDHPDTPIGSRTESNLKPEWNLPLVEYHDHKKRERMKKGTTYLSSVRVVVLILTCMPGDGDSKVAVTSMARRGRHHSTIT